MRCRTRFIDGQDYHRAGVMNDIAAGADASGLLDVIGSYPKKPGRDKPYAKKMVWALALEFLRDLTGSDLEREDFAIRTI